MDGKPKCPLFLYILAKNICIPFRGQGNDKPVLLDYPENGNNMLFRNTC
jgi:hypothetical protein